MTDNELKAWLSHALQTPGLPDVLNIFKRRIELLTPAALAVGDTDRQKTEIATLEYVIYEVEHFTVVDTDTETGDNA